MSPVTHQLHVRRILDRVAEHECCSQRSLSRDLGIALGLTNLLVRRLAARGWIRIVRIRPNHLRYTLTPAGVAQQARLSRDDLVKSVRYYVEARDRIQRRLGEMLTASAGRRCRSVVFFGTGATAEVAWVCMQRARLSLVGVVDDRHAGETFFGHVVQPSTRLTAERCDAVRYDRIIVMTSGTAEASPLFFERLGVPRQRVYWLDDIDAVNAAGHDESASPADP